MKQIVRISFLLVAAAALTLSCSKDMGSPVPQDQENQVIMTVTIPNDLTKVSFTKDSDVDGAVKVAWEGTDKIRVIDHNDANNHQQFSIQAGYTDHSASFAGTEVTAASYDILYPGTMESVAEAEAVQYGVQTQTGDASTAHLAYMALLSGVDTYEDVDFSEAWATAHGGTFKQSGILRLRIQLPDAINSSKIASLTVNAPSALFYKSNACIAGEKVSSVKLNFSGEGATPVEGVVTGFIMLPWENVSVAANTQLSVIVETAAHAFYTKSFTPSTTETKTFAMGRVNAVKLNNTGFGAASSTFAGGSGTPADPWLIANATHMGNIASNLSTIEKKYFKLIDNITITSWTSLNSDNNKSIDLNGNGKTISGLNKQLFDYLDGEVSYLNITNATVSSSGSYYGVLVRTISKENCVISNVSVSNSSVSGAGYIGGLIGRIGGPTLCKVTNCSADVNVTGSSYYLGGLIGYMTGGTIEGCHATGDVTCNLSGIYAHIGGLIGTVVGGTIKNCYATGDVNETVSGKGALLGGLIGDFAGPAALSNSYATGNVTSTYTRAGGLVGGIGKCAVSISDCYCTGDVTANNDSGGFVGYVEDDAAANLTITNGYSTSGITVNGAKKGILCGNTSSKGTITCIGFVNLSDTALYYGSVNPISGHETENYSGTEGTILSHAQAFSWDFTKIWNEINPPTLK